MKRNTIKLTENKLRSMVRKTLKESFEAEESECRGRRYNEIFDDEEEMSSNAAVYEIYKIASEALEDVRDIEDTVVAKNMLKEQLQLIISVARRAKTK